MFILSLVTPQMIQNNQSACLEKYGHLMHLKMSIIRILLNDVSFEGITNARMFCESHCAICVRHIVICDCTFFITLQHTVFFWRRRRRTGACVNRVLQWYSGDTVAGAAGRNALAYIVVYRPATTGNDAW